MCAYTNLTSGLSSNGWPMAAAEPATHQNPSLNDVYRLTCTGFHGQSCSIPVNVQRGNKRPIVSGLAGDGTPCSMFDQSTNLGSTLALADPPSKRRRGSTSDLCTAQPAARCYVCLQLSRSLTSGSAFCSTACWQQAQWANVNQC